MKGITVDKNLVRSIQDEVEKAFMLVHEHIPTGERPLGCGGAFMFSIIHEGELEVIDFEIVRETQVGKDAEGALKKVSVSLCEDRNMQSRWDFHKHVAAAAYRVEIPTREIDPSGRGETTCVLAVTGFDTNINACAAACYIAAHRLEWEVVIGEAVAASDNGFLARIIHKLRQEAMW